MKVVAALLAALATAAVAPEATEQLRGIAERQAAETSLEHVITAARAQALNDVSLTEAAFAARESLDRGAEYVTVTGGVDSVVIEVRVGDACRAAQLTDLLGPADRFECSP